MFNKIKTARLYVFVSMVVIGYYVYSLLNGIAFWESSTVTRNTENNTGRVRGVHTFYHK